MEAFLMSEGERKRLEVFSQVKAGKITLVKASEILNLSYQQTKRFWRRYVEVGDAGLVHRLRGQPANRRAMRNTKRKYSRGM